MQKELIMVRFGELSTKGKNKMTFINKLGENIRHALKSFENLKIEVKRDHIYIHLHGEDYDAVASRLKDVSGLLSFSLVYKVENDIEKMKEATLKLLEEEGKHTFKMKAKRADKVFPMVSDDINRAIAGYVLKNSSYKVDVHNPDVTVSLTVRKDETYIYVNQVMGAGGYPLGIAGKGMMMMSGGIDSPVACYMMMKRGVKMECIHFAAPPYTNQAVITKITDLLKVLSRYQGQVRLFVVPFTKLQLEIYRAAHEEYAITIMRRMMYRISETIAIRNNCKCLVNGESIGQVASQTLTSMTAINAVTNMPVIRPVACLDKNDIIDIAKTIDTYEISIEPFEDCCTIFVPKHPVINPDVRLCEEYETNVDYDALVKKAVETEEIIKVENGVSSQIKEDFKDLF